MVFSGNDVTTVQSERVHPLISIVTVTWNCVTTIERTLLSVQAVKKADVEYIVIDGVSSDGTLEVIRSFPDLVDVLVSERDSGIYNAMNKAIALAKGKYILFINGDDALIPEAFLSAKAQLATTQALVFSCGCLAVAEDGSESTLLPQPSRLYFYNSIPHPSTFVATEVLKGAGFREDLRIASDYDLFLRLKMQGKKFAVSALTIALHHRGGASADTHRSEREIETIKRDNLGHFYFLAKAFQGLHRLRKRLLSF